MATLNLLYKYSLPITKDIAVVIPRVRDIIEHEDEYYGMVTTFTAMPIDMMVQLDDLGLDFEKMSAFDLFLLLFSGLTHMDTHLLLGDLDLSKFRFSINEETGATALIDTEHDIKIDKVVHGQIAAALRRIHHIEQDNRRPGNHAAREYMLERARVKMERHKGKARESQLEPLIISMVNTSEFKYNFESVLDLSIYQFNESVRQVVHKIDYDNLMHGVYVGMIDSKKLSQDDMNWLIHK